MLSSVLTGQLCANVTLFDTSRVLSSATVAVSFPLALVERLRLSRSPLEESMVEAERLDIVMLVCL